MTEELRLRTLLLQVLRLIGLVMFWNPKVVALVALLQAIVTDHWDEFWPLLQKAPAARRRALLRAGGEVVMGELLRTARRAR